MIRADWTPLWADSALRICQRCANLARTAG